MHHCFTLTGDESVRNPEPVRPGESEPVRSSGRHGRAAVPQRGATPQPRRAQHLQHAQRQRRPGAGVPPQLRSVSCLLPLEPRSHTTPEVSCRTKVKTAVLLCAQQPLKLEVWKNWCEMNIGRV